MPRLLSDCLLAWTLLGCSAPTAAPADSAIATHERPRILAAAERALNATPLTITSFPAKLSEGGRNDFYSNGDYWWPDPTKPNGLPYLRRDGQTNPENFGAHRNALNTFRDQVAALAAAYRLTHEEKYAAHAVRFLDTFLLDPSTRMNPHLKFAQAIPGRNPGRGIGIIPILLVILTLCSYHAAQLALRCSPRTQRTVPELARMTTLSVVILPSASRFTPSKSDPSVTPVAAKMQSPLASSFRS